MSMRVVDHDPAGPGVFLRAGLSGLPGANSLPGIAKTGKELPDLTLVRRGVEIDSAHVDRYREVCGFVRRESLPMTYPHLLGFGLTMMLMTDPAFPHAPIGQVHVRNVIRARRALLPNESFDVSVRATNQREHPKGLVYDMLTSVESEGEVVWDEVSTYLRPGRPHPEAAHIAGPEEVPGSGIEWKLPGDLGRTYAAVSGDRNPIHLFALSAKAFGFKQQIAHGMWSLARCVATIESRVPVAAEVDAVFKRPIFLPSRVEFGSRVDSEGVAFGLNRPGDGGAHLAGFAR